MVKRVSLKTAITKSDLQKLEIAIARFDRTLKPREITKLRSEIVGYISNGLERGYHVALVKPLKGGELNLKILNWHTEIGEKRKGVSTRSALKLLPRGKDESQE